MKSLWKYLAVCARTNLAIQLLGVLMSAPYIAFYRYDFSEIGSALEIIPFMMLVGAILIFPLTLLYSIVLARIVIHSLRRNWPTWIPYIVSGVLTTIVFTGLVSLSERPIPDLAMYFVQEAPSVYRPSLAASEVPLLLIWIIAGFLGTWMCVRVVRYGLDQNVTQQETED